jgi:hypothetical protein
MYSNKNIDLEWENFISTKNYDESSDDELNEIDKKFDSDNFVSANISNELFEQPPKPSDIYISTKTKIAYLNKIIDLKTIFWKVDIVPYYKPINGVIKKQIKFNSQTVEELQYIQEKLKDIEYYDEHVITNINNPSGRIKFKDIRKISIGVSKKDLLSYRCKKKSAFYNCFVLILRMKIKDTFKEFHVKVFNTGKVEIPGIQSEDTFNKILELIIIILQPFIEEKLEFKNDSNETVLINSNFNCGFYINRELLHDILKDKYNIQCIYDPCSYPGIQCKFYYNSNSETHNGILISKQKDTEEDYDLKEVSFMIFRTGSVLIVGKCDEDILFKIYDFLKEVLVNEYKAIFQKNSNQTDSSSSKNIVKEKKIRKKNIVISCVQKN